MEALSLYELSLLRCAYSSLPQHSLSITVTRLGLYAEEGPHKDGSLLSGTFQAGHVGTLVNVTRRGAQAPA